MIKTVFYFTETEQQYLSQWRNGEVSPNTIVLCKDTHSLWKGGERYGVGSTPEGDDYVPYDDTEIVERINDIVEQLEDLAEQIGHGEKGMTDEEKEQMENLAEQLVAVSNGLDTANEVAASEKQRLNGLLDGIQASIDSMTAQAEADEASIQQLAADIQSQAASIQEHSEWIQNREEEDTTSWKSGWNANIEAYLQEVGIWARDNGITETQFTQLSQSVDTISSSVNNLQEDMQTKATKTEFSTITQRADAIETRVASVETGLDDKATTTQFSQLSQTVDGINTRVSSVEEDVEGKVGASEFSTLSQRVNSIDLAVQALTPSEDGSISDQMQATIEQAVRDGVAELNLSATYAKKSTETDLEATQDELENAEKVLEWMYSGLKISTDPEKTFNELVSAGKEGLANAVADLRTYVQKLKNGDYVASTAITSAVNNAIAALYSEASDNNAKSLIFSKIASNTNSISGLETDMDTAQDTIEQLQEDLSDGLNNINQNTQDIAAIVTSATGDNTSATIATKFANWKAGLATTSYVDGATAGLVSSDVLDQRVASFISQSDLDAATATMASKTQVDGLGTRLSSVETKANANEASITNLTTTGGRIAQVEQKANDTEAAISGLVDASTDTVTASKIWESLANDNSVISSMRSQFATTVDGDGIASLVKEDIAQSVNNSTWDQWVAYMKGDVATAVNNYQTATANKAQWDAVVAYVDGKKTDIESIDDLSDSVSGLNTSLAGLSSSVGTLENEVTGIKSNYAKTLMFAQIKDNQGNVTAASIAAAVNGTTGSSKVTIDADHIDVSGVLTVANNAASAASAAQDTADSALAATTTIDGGNITTGTINSDRLNVSTIVGKINSSTGQNKLTINADHIDVSGVLTVANNAANAASTAQSAANAAQSTADSAASAASTAQSTADSKLNSSAFTPANIISKINDTTNTTTIDGGKITTGSITASQIKANTITANELASKTITADQIATGAITTDKIAANAITAAKIDTTDLTVKKLRADNATNNKNVTVVNGDGISVTQNGAIGFQANADGSGSAARGNISWTTNGTLSVNGAITATSLVIGEGVSVPYSKLSGTPTIPTKTSQLTNDSSYATTSQIPDISGKMDSSSFTQGNIIKAINGNTNTTTIDGGKITTGSITATQIDATNLQVAAANITGTLTASQINTAGLSVAAANITGKLTASQIDATNLQVAAANITGTLTASQINTANLHVSAANIDGTIAAGTLAASKSFTSGGIALTGHTEITGDGFVNYVTRDGVSGKSNMNAINLDGSGYLANNKISWDASGNFQLGNNAIQYDASNSRLSISAYNVAMQSLQIQDLETTGGLIVGSDTAINGELSVQGIVTSGIECSGAISGSAFSATSTSSATGYPVTKTTAISSSSWSITNTSTINQQAIKTEVNITPSAFVMTSKVNNATETEQIKLNINGSGSLASGNISWTTAGVLSTKGLSVTGDSTSNSVYSNCLYVHDADANDIFLAESDGTISFIGENTGVSFDDGAYITGDLPVRGTVEANALQIKYNNTVVGGIDVSGLITGKNLSIVGNSTGKIIVSYGAQDVRVTPSSYSISDSSSSSAATLTSTYLSVAKSGNTAKLSIDSSGNIELVGSVTSGSSVGNSIWPTVTRDTTASTPTKGRVYAITLGDLKTMIQDSTGTYSTKYGNWSVMLTRTA